MNKIKIMTIIILVLAAPLLLSEWVRSGKAELIDQRDERIPVRTAEVYREDIVIPIQTSGILSSKSEIKLSFKTGGIISKLNADEGDQIQKGHQLASLDLSEINARVAKARSVLEKADRDFARIVNLYKDSVVTREQYENVQTALEIARSDLKIAEFNRAHSVISAPADGRILKRLSEEKELISPGNPVFLFGSSEHAWVIRAGISDKDILRVNEGDSADIHFDAYPGKSFKAKVTEKAESANPATGTFEIELSVIPDENKLISGFVGKIKIYPSNVIRRFTLPVESILEMEGSIGYVFVPFDDNRNVKKLPVELLFLVGDRIAVEDDLARIERIVSEGVPYLYDGASVQIIN